ncbi:response regulator [Candidatus Nitrospira bockiana]
MTKQILVVDDDPVALDAMAETLRSRLPGVEVAQCVSAQRAYEAVAYFNYDLVISDVRMPEMKGTELLNRIKAIRPALPVLLISGHREEAPPAPLAASARFLSKPVDRHALAQVVREALNQA